VSSKGLVDALELVDYDDAVTRYEPVIGLETHVELGTASKMFCGCATAFGAEPNTQVCPTCLGLPGALPVVNAEAVRATVLIGLALHCSIAPWCRFARKNYFYPDMPKNFQISQYDEPLCVDGYLDVAVPGEDGESRAIRIEIERVHMEEDTGKSLHVGGATGRIHGATHSLVDYNRAGIPLVEIVTRPVEADAAAPVVARAYVQALAELVRSLGVSDVRMEQGSLRCDVNTSLRPRGTAAYGTRSETKNVNSFRSVERAVRFEVSRQAGLLDGGVRVVQETRHFHEDTGTSSSGRSKEEATDYRYFPEPDLVPIALGADYVEAVRQTLPETPTARRARLRTEYGFSDLDLDQLGNAGVLDAVLETVGLGAEPAAARAMWLNEVSARANESGVSPAELPVRAEHVARLLALIGDGTLTSALARQALDGVLAGEGDVDAVVAARGLAVVSDDAALQDAVDAAIAAQPAAADKVRGGNMGALGPLIGAAMKATGGKADAARIRGMLLSSLGANG
jgi:aspartyl-tRNA(Asn)/glutamyl-tRNA(Gln) amidotransferase subunit B